MDGLAGMIPLQVFKVDKDKLPFGYQRKDIVFIIKSEEHKITSGQDWVTKIGGKMIILPTDNQGKEVAAVISSGGSSPKTLEPPQSIEKKLTTPILTEERSQEIINPPAR